MKKTTTFLVVTGLVALSFSLTALASTAIFSDEASFDEWYAAAAKKMQFNNIFSGYADGSFQGDKTVSRAELAVVLDRFASNVVGSDLSDSPQVCTLQYVSGLEITLQDQNGNPITGAQITSSPEQEFSEGLDNGEYSGLGEAEGYFTVTISKEGYSSYVETIKLEQNKCHVIPQQRTVTLIAK